MKKLIFLLLVAVLAVTMSGCQHPIIKPTDEFVNITVGPEVEYYWRHDLETEKKFVVDKASLDARLMNLKRMRKLIEEAKKERGDE